MATSTPLILLMVNVAPEADAARCKGLGFRVYRSFNFQGRVDKKFDAPSCGVLRMKKIHTSNFQGLEP